MLCVWYIHLTRAKPIRERGCYIRTVTARVQLQKKKLWSWASWCLAPRWTDWRWTASHEVTLTLILSCWSSRLRVAVVRSEQLVAEAGGSLGTQRKGMSAVGSRYQATASEDWEDFMCAVVTVIFGMCETVVVICSYELFKSSINLITNPKPICHHLSHDSIQHLENCTLQCIQYNKHKLHELEIVWNVTV
jgi:hypothetical protein